MFRTERNLPIVKIMYCSADTPKGYQLTLFGPRGADYTRHITTGPPSFWTMRRLCVVYYLLLFCF